MAKSAAGQRGNCELIGRIAMLDDTSVTIAGRRFWTQSAAMDQAVPERWSGIGAHKVPNCSAPAEHMLTSPRFTTSLLSTTTLLLTSHGAQRTRHGHRVLESGIRHLMLHSHDK